MNFEEYLTAKKIDGPAFKAAEPLRWQEWKTLFDTVSEQSFTVQKFYLINPIRRKYLLNPIAPAATDVAEAKPKISKPVFKPKIN